MSDDLVSLAKTGDILTVVTLLFVVYLFVTNIISNFMGKLKKIKLGNAVELEKTDAGQDGMGYILAEIKTIKKELCQVRGLFGSTHSDIKVLADSVHDLKLGQLKLMFYSTDMENRPSERLLAGLYYIDCGGNGEVKADVIKFARDNPVIYKALVAAKPELKLADLRGETA